MQQADTISQSTLDKSYLLRCHLGNLRGNEAKYLHLFEVIFHICGKVH